MRSRPCRTLLLSIVLVSLAATPVGANCMESIMPVFQCGFAAWFGPIPGGAGDVSPVWWQLGYGNNRVNNGLPSPEMLEGTGIAPLGVFSGNDSGLATLYMTDAATVLPQYGEEIPPRALCSNFENSWASPNADGCADSRRTGLMADDDNLLNPYWGLPYQYCPYDDCPYETTSYLTDYPMALLLRESTNRFFAIAFVASKSRHGDSTDTSEGFFDLAEVVNGDPNPVFPGRNNIIPWQHVPVPRITGSTPGPPTTLELSWDNVRAVSDLSTRPTGFRAEAPVIAGGVGVLDQGLLVRYVVETAPLSGSLDPNDPGLVWTTLTEISPPAGPVVTTSLSYSEPTAVRVRTVLGKTPRTASTLLSQVRTGSSGDLGFEATRCMAGDCPGPPPALVLTVCDDDFDGDGISLCDGDCDDTDASMYPGAPEICDLGNNNCLHPAWPDRPGDEVDDDGDGHSECGGDCLDTNPTVYPGAPQPCDGLNNDCLHPGWPSLAGLNEEDGDGDGISVCLGDCRDFDASIYPGAPEVCDGRNNDCLYPGWPELLGIEFDDDGDLLTECRGDCNDNNHLVRPGGAQLCDGVNNDCLDPAWPSIAGINEGDDDGDGWNECQGDCADSDFNRHPGGVEVCNQLDDDCDQIVDEGPTGIDTDNDGVHNICDNCLTTVNPDQADTDHDGQGDACDLNDHLVFVDVSTPSTVRYDLEQGFVSFNIYRGDVAVLRATGVYTQNPATVPGAARFCSRYGGTLLDSVLPAAGKIFFYLPTGEDASGNECSLGSNCMGETRLNTNPCP